MEYLVKHGKWDKQADRILKRERRKKMKKRFKKRPLKVNWTHQTYISSPEWKKRRVLFFKKYPKRCTACHATKHIHLHHVSYRRLGKELDKDLVPLCKKCHKDYHEQFGSSLDMMETTYKFIINYRKDNGKTK